MSDLEDKRRAIVDLNNELTCNYEEKETQVKEYQQKW